MGILCQIIYLHRALKVCPFQAGRRYDSFGVLGGSETPNKRNLSVQIRCLRRPWFCGDRAKIWQILLPGFSAIFLLLGIFLSFPEAFGQRFARKKKLKFVNIFFLHFSDGSFIDSLCGLRTGQAVANCEVLERRAFSLMAIIPFVSGLITYEHAVAFEAKALPVGNDILFPQGQTVPGRPEGLHLIHHREFLIGSRIRTDNDLLPAFLRLSVTGSIASVNICTLHIEQGVLDQLSRFVPVNFCRFRDAGNGFVIAAAAVSIEKRHDLSQLVVGIIGLYRAAAPRIQIAARTQDPDPAPISGKVWDPEALPADAPNCTPETWVYRNKAQFPVQPQFGRAKAGFYRLHTHDVVPIDRCLIQDPAADTAKQIVQDWAERYKISAYDEIEHRGLLRHIFVRKGFVSGQVMVCLVINGRELPRQEELLSRLKWGVPGLASVVLSFNQKRTNVVLGEEFRTIFGKDYIEDSLCGFTFRLSPRSFYQVNHDQAQRLYEKAIEFANLTGRETVLDLYCGTGTITLALSRRAGRAIGVEIIPQAIEDARENAARNGVENVEFFCADAGEAAKRLAGQQAAGNRQQETGSQHWATNDNPEIPAPGTADSGQQPVASLPLAGKEPPQGADGASSVLRSAAIAAGPDVIVVDPPRKGLSPDVIDAMVAMAPARIVYVSCDPATLARDVKLLTAQGYTLTQTEAFDLFPRTFHVETVVSLSQLKSDV